MGVSILLNWGHGQEVWQVSEEWISGDIWHISHMSTASRALCIPKWNGNFICGTARLVNKDIKVMNDVVKVCNTINKGC